MTKWINCSFYIIQAMNKKEKYNNQLSKKSCDSSTIMNNNKLMT